MRDARVPLYERLPEIYRIKDEQQDPPGQLKNYVSLVEGIFGAIHANIASLYHDLFIETCDDWVVPYIGDLLGTSHLKGDPWTLRADVADTVALRRRKGTLGAIERLTYDLTRWGVHCVELRENLVWGQHLNHQRPDAGGEPPYGLPPDTSPADVPAAPPTRHRVVRGGTVTLRQPAALSLLNTVFDPFAHTADLRPPAFGNARYNLPNLAIFLWRLRDYQVRVSKPVPADRIHANPSASGSDARFVARFDIHPLGEVVRLFNTHRFDPDKDPPVITRVDETPGPIPTERLAQGSAAANPEAYVAIEPYDEGDVDLQRLRVSKVGLQLHVPASQFGGDAWPSDSSGWSVRGANLCAWENGLQPPLRDREVAIDPVTGRIAVGVRTRLKGRALLKHLLLTCTYGAVGPVGAHPTFRAPAPKEWNGKPVDYRYVNFHEDPDGLENELNGIRDSSLPTVIEIKDSMTHELNLSRVRLNRSLIIRAASDQRPIIRLRRPLRFRPTNVKGRDDEEQKQFDAVMSSLTGRLEGLYITRDTNGPLIGQSALNRLEIVDCTLDPGGALQIDGSTRKPIRPAMRLPEGHGFTDSGEREAFNQTPEIVLERSIAGPLFIDRGHTLHLTDSIIDAGKGPGDDPGKDFAVSGTRRPKDTWGPPTRVSNVTVLGRMRARSVDGGGGIWVHRLEVQDQQTGCIKFSYFSGDGDLPPQSHACVTGGDGARLRFVSTIFGQPAYGQLAHGSDFRIRERGPKDDAMGAYGFLLDAHKWRNLQIRYREFMPVGVRPLLIPVT